MIPARSFPVRSALVLSALAALVSVSACKEKSPEIPDAAGLVAPAPTETAPATLTDFSQCVGCQLTAQQTWTFQGIYRDDACTDPLVQQAPSACAPVPGLGSASVTYVEEVGGRKAGEVANVELTEQVAPTAARFRKSGTKCVRADESAVDLTPAGCAGEKVCRDASGALACANCRTFPNGCPDFEESRIYAAVNDPAIKKVAGGGGGGGNLARLRQCCAALAAEAKRMGSSPEAGMLSSAAAQCTALVTAAGPNGTAPELGAIRTALAGRNVPAICAGF
ncbi:MAG: hypothetical protein KF850_41830 [Labilithrix sp.]|nr:hypothetical protein [Labilithrix sp.]MBX3218620.1 hypothetical protein [Labilithrix sp.]